ncbi:MAG: 5-oxoprolinase [Rhodospirillaceae bacterium]|nr:5-oxoprolinase [Rhodospirillaceae bacterium]
MNTDNKWQFWVDRGGTFTDVVARRPDGVLLTHKVLSENPERYNDAAIQGIREILGLDDTAPLPTDDIDVIKMGTTVATNALLERTGDRTVLVITEGFSDALRIGYQSRPDIFALKIELPELLYEQVVTAKERIGAHGDVICPLDKEALRADLQAAFDAGIRSCAIVLMHGYRFTDHERTAADIAREIGFTQVSVSHRVSPLMRLVGRGDTTVVDAYLSPILRRYVDQVAAQTGDARLMFMKSDGGLTDARRFEGKDAILSGPAGGIVACAGTGLSAGFDKVIGFDMGGTSTDVCHFAGEFERSFETEVAGVRMRVPMMNIHTVAAGGGSILTFAHGRFQVGPQSAGANPGPAAYRRGGPLTVTDCNIQLGKLQPELFPKVFGPGGDQGLDADIVNTKFQALAAKVRDQLGWAMTPMEVAQGFLKVAIENMASACKRISVQRGYDVTSYALNCFGGAGGQHACLVADALGMSRVLVHPYAGVLSAYGMGLADVTTLKDRSFEEALNDAAVARIDELLTQMTADGTDELLAQGIPTARISARHKVRVKYQGTDTALVVDFGDTADITARFEAAHRQQFGFLMQGAPLIVAAVQVEVIGASGEAGIEEAARVREESEEPLKAIKIIETYMADVCHATPFYDREQMAAGDVVSGPAVIMERVSTIVVEPGWQATLAAKNHILIERVVPLPGRVEIGSGVDPIMLEVFNNLFMSVAEQMGVTLRNTAYSANIKERLDFSCALFDPDGGLVANAPHVPVHLGSMGTSVRAIIAKREGTMAHGDVYMLNNPYDGGTHLPDITLITPVFDATGNEVIFFVACRAHHADIGGITPGSMPPHSTSIVEEGVLIDNFHLVKDGVFMDTECRALFAAGEHPSRNIDQNILDLKAQVAANEKGVRELLSMVDQFGLDTVHAYMGYVQKNAEEQVRSVIDVLSDGEFSVTSDDGSTIRVAIRIDRQARGATIDFTGTSAQQASNFNAPRAVTHAAVLYVFRTLVDSDIPMNEGCTIPLQIITPDGSMLNPVFPAAVVAGNVEVSQCVTDCLYGALGVMASAQGTMNNFTFGNDTHQHYETICGGAGAGDGFNGASAVHTHMTNSRLTDPEILEWRFPVILEEFSIRRGSGGDGDWHGGDGCMRRIRFMEPMEAAILANHHSTRPFGLNGGGPGAAGRAWVERKSGEILSLTATDCADVDVGDVFVVETPGGGGFGQTGQKTDESME